MEQGGGSQAKGIPISEKIIREALGPELAGVADVLEILRKNEGIETIDQLMNSIRSHINEFGNFEIRNDGGYEVIMEEVIVETIEALEKWIFEETRRCS